MEISNFKKDDKLLMEEEFKQYIKEARYHFVSAVNKTEWNTELRTECENLLIAYDQMAERIEKLSIARRSFEDIVWMAIRYAHGRSTFSPITVRDAVKSYKAAFPDFMIIREQESDYLNDLFDVANIDEICDKNKE